MWHSSMTWEDIYYLPEGGYQYDRGTNPAQSDGVGGGAYKILHLLLRLVTNSILLVFCRDCLFKKNIATTWHISFIYMQFHFFLNPYFSNISIIMCLKIRGFSLILGSSSVRCSTLTKMSPNVFITHRGVHKLLTPPPIGTFFSFKVSSSLLLIEIKHCWSSKGQKLFDPLGLLPHPVIN